MPILERHWEKLTEEHWRRLAENWLRCIREHRSERRNCCRWGDIVVNLGMWGTPEELWQFIKRTVSMAETQLEFGRIAAGPIEYLLGRFGPDYIDRVEAEVQTNSKFATAIKGCNQYMMTDEVWSRVKLLQS
jgi:hypothetical protein